MRKDRKDKTSDLRQKAEKLHKKRAIKSDLDHHDSQNLKLVHELEVHKIELELQNQELIMANRKAEKYFELYDFSPVGNFTLSREGKIVELNIIGSRILNKERIYLKNKIFELFVSHDTKPIFDIFIDKVFKSKVKESCQLTLLTDSKVPIYVHINGIVSENTEQCYLTMIDISHLKQAEQKVKESEEKLRTIITTASEGYFVINEKGDFIDINQAYSDLLGYTKEELFDMSIHDIEVIESQDETELHMKQLMETGNDCFETFQKRKDGSFINVEISASHFKLTENQFVGFVRDITDRKKTEIALRENEKFLKEVQTIARLGSYKLDFISNKWYSSEILDEIVGIGKDFDRSLKGWASLIHPFWKKNLTDYFIQGMKSNKTKIDMEFKIIRQTDKTERWVHGIGNFIFNDKNQPISMTGTIRDITYRKLTEEKLKIKMDELVRLNKELEKFAYANQELEQFAYIASHNLQEPLRTISNYVNIFEEDYPEQFDESARKYLHVINDATKRMILLLDSLLDFSRLGRNLKLTNVDCKKLINTVIADLETMITTSGAGIEVADMPKLAVYESEFSQLFQNLIINAIKFRRKDTPPKIKISSEQLNTAWKFSVSDNGIGIAAKNFDKIYDIFQRLHSNSEYQGNGIGLAFCRKIVQLHKGEIWVESTLGKGSTFHFTISNLAE